MLWLLHQPPLVHANSVATGHVVNSYTCLILICNSIYLFFLIIANDKVEASEHGPLALALEHLYMDQYRSVYCALRYFFSSLYLPLTIDIIVLVIFIRSMMIKFAPDIRTKMNQCKSHYAHLARIGLIGGLLIGTCFLGVITVFLVHPKSLFDFPYVLHCRGVPRTYSTEEMTKLWSTWLARLMSLIILSWATVSCHV